MTDRSQITPIRDVDTLAADWVAKLLSGDVAASEMAALRAWIAADPAHAEAYERARAIWRDMPQPVPAPTRRRARVGGAMAAAAALVFAAVLSPELLFPPDLASTTGEIRALTLPDGTRAWLDSDSAVDLAFTDEAREVSLRRGRVFFDVAEADRPFRVLASGSRISDIGTAFSVDVTGIAAELDVVVDEGAVAVERGALREELAAGERGLFGQEAHVARAGSPDVSGWREGRISLDRMPLGQALAEIDRYRPGRIVALGLSNESRRVSGTLFADRLGEGLDTLARDQRLRLTRLPWLVIVRDAEN